MDHGLSRYRATRSIRLFLFETMHGVHFFFLTIIHLESQGELSSLEILHFIAHHKVRFMFFHREMRSSVGTVKENEQWIL